MAWATSSSSRTAIQARPRRESRSRQEMKPTSRQPARIR